MNKNTQYKFIKTLCDLSDGENSVKHSKIQTVFPECPSHNVISNMGYDMYFTWDGDIKNPGYFPTSAAFQFVFSTVQNRKSVRISIACLIVGILTLAATVATLFISCS